MRTLLFLSASLAALGMSVLTVSGAGPKGELVVTVDYERQSGPGSNQFAIYVENGNGEIVRTLYVTKFTADGGYVRRPACTPVWVAKSKVADMTAAGVDAITGATPQSGSLRYVWDLKDAGGNEVPDGQDRLVVEGTYWQDNQVVFTAPFNVGGDSVGIDAVPEYNTGEEKNRGMIRAVYMEYKK